MDHTICMDSDPGERTIREPVVEGVFYPSEAGQLEGEIRTRLQASSIIADRARAIVVPYAGYAYCGNQLAAGYKACAALQIERAIIVGPSHHDPGDGVFLPESRGFRVPTGVLPVDVDSVVRAAGESVVVDDLPHLDEHSIEIQLPFVRYLYPKARVVPVLVGRPTVAGAAALAGALGRIAPSLTDRDLLIVSSNLSGSLDRRDARREAGMIIDLILENDWKGLRWAMDGGGLSAAGAACLAGALEYLDGSGRWEVIDQGSSFAVDADPSNCVEYAAIVHGRDYVR